MGFFNAFIVTLLILVWLYFLHLTKKANVHFWHFIVGAVGLFIILMVFFEPVLMPYVNLVLTALISVLGNITGWFTTIYDLTAVFITTNVGSLLLQIDIECSGVIEILAYLSIIIFFDPFDTHDKIVYGLVGVVYILIANAIRVDMISTIVYFFGIGAYDFAHTILGRIVFYLLTVILYYYVFTRPQLKRTVTKEFAYETKQGDKDDE